MFRLILGHFERRETSAGKFPAVPFRTLLNFPRRPLFVHANDVDRYLQFWDNGFAKRFNASINISLFSWLAAITDTVELTDRLL